MAAEDRRTLAEVGDMGKDTDKANGTSDWEHTGLARTSSGVRPSFRMHMAEVQTEEAYSTERGTGAEGEEDPLVAHEVQQAV